MYKIIAIIILLMLFLMIIYSIYDEIIRHKAMKKAKELGKQFNNLNIDHDHRQQVINELENAKTGKAKLKILERELKRLKELNKRIQ